ncbi:translational machinery protein, partial [Bradyrhizobium sp. CNPSo 4019]|nr:translational machinery protein [Bradyrhizobium diversitatis]
MPSHFHAVIWIDHSQARIFHFGLGGSDEITLHPHLATRHLHHKANAIGSGHAAPDKAFYTEVTKAVADAG